MLQRKQSLYLLVAMLLILSNLANPFVSVDNLIFTAFKLQQTGISDPITIGTFPIAIYAIILSLLHIFTIMLFKKRPLQMRFTLLSIFLSVGFYGILFFYHFMSKDIISIEFSQYGFELISPILAAIFDFMAYKGIKKDEKLVRDSDRFR